MSSNSSVVYPFSKRRRSKRAEPERLERGEGDLVWKVAAIEDAPQCAKWLDKFIEGKPYEGQMLSIWTHHARTRTQVERLASFVPPIWLAEDGSPLLAKAVDMAASKVFETITDNTASLPRVLGLYLWGLLTIHAEVGRRVIRGVDKDGTVRAWEPFQVPLLEWARSHGMTEVLASSVPEGSQEWHLGLRIHMQAAISHPVEIGYMLKYAPLG